MAVPAPTSPTAVRAHPITIRSEPASDPVLRRKLAHAQELLRAGQIASAQAMLTHVVDVASTPGSDDMGSYAIALVLLGSIGEC